MAGVERSAGGEKGQYGPGRVVGALRASRYELAHQVPPVPAGTGPGATRRW